MSHAPHGAGKNSFDKIDAQALLRELEPLSGRTVLDLGCGFGDYSLALAERIGPQGAVHAMDPWEEGIRQLRQRADKAPGAPVHTHVADATAGIPLPDGSVDTCLMAAVLHDIIHDGGHSDALREVARVLKPEGALAVLEFRKLDEDSGPPRHIRLSEEELDEVLAPHGFAVHGTSSNGDRFYLALCRQG